MTETKDKYIGILYGGFIATANGVYVLSLMRVLEILSRLNVLSILESDFVALCIALTKGTLEADQVVFSQKSDCM